MWRKAAIAGGIGLSTAAFIAGVRGRPDVAAAVLRIASAHALGQPTAAADQAMFKEFARSELGALGQQLRDLAAREGAIAADRLRTWVNAADGVGSAAGAGSSEPDAGWRPPRRG